MVKQFKIAGITAAVLCTGAAVVTAPTTAAASTVSISVIAASGDGSNAAANTSDVFASGYGAALPAGASWTTVPGAFEVTPPPGSVSGEYRSPWDSNTLEDVNSYYAVGPNTEPNPVKLQFSAGQSAFNILWGSVDDYNSLAFSGIAGGSDVSVNGTAIATAVNAAFADTCGSPGNYACTALLSFSFLDDRGNATTFSTASFSSSNQAFEFALAPVPLPAAGFLLFGALGGLAAMRRRKKAVAA